MIIHKAYKIRIYPNAVQKEMIEKTFGCTRFVYNYFLSERKEKYEKDKVSINVYKQLLKLTELKRNYLWLKEVDSIALQKCIFNLDKAFENFYHGKGYPKFRAKGKHDTYQTEIRINEYKGVIHENIRIDFKKREITLPKLKQMKFRGYRNIK